MGDTSKVWNCPMKHNLKPLVKESYPTESYLVMYWFQKSDLNWDTETTEIFLTGDSKDQHERAWETLRDSLGDTPCKLVSVVYV